MRRSGVAALTGLALLATGCTATPAQMVVPATVADDTEALTVPYLAVPEVNLDAGFTDSTGDRNPVTGRVSARAGTLAGALGLGATARVTSVKVSAGDEVKAGQVVATLDTSLVRAALAAAKADSMLADVQPRLLNDAIKTTYDRQADIKDSRRKINDAIAKIHQGRAELLKTRSTLRKALPKLKKALAQIDQAVAALPPGVPPPPELLKTRAKLVAQSKKVSAGLKKINVALPKLSRGLQKARSGLSKLNDAEAKITDARGSLRDLKKLAELQADATKVSIDAARIQVSQATLTAPVNGVVLWVASTGDELAPNATVASFRRAGPSTVTAWVPPEQLSELCVGDAASITADWTAAATPASLISFGTKSEYPPTWAATQEVHLTRAVEVKFRADSALPAGTPVEVRVEACRPAASPDERNG